MIVGVCEDNSIFMEAIVSSIKQWNIEHRHNISGIKTYETAEQFIFDWDGSATFDIVFLDIDLPKMNGYELAKKIRERDDFLPIVFITNYQSYSTKGYEVSAYRYLMKPVRSEQIGDCLDYANERSKYGSREFVSIHAEDTNYRIPVNNVLYISSEGHYAQLYTTDHKMYRLLIKNNLDELFDILSSDKFIRCHRGFLVNLQNVQQYTKKTILLFDGTEIPIGRKYSEEVIKRLSYYFFGKIK